MTVAELREALPRLPNDAVVLIDDGGGLWRVAALDFVGRQGPEAAVGCRPELERRS